jgi:multiple sugar transport system ATP-binding protein
LSAQESLPVARIVVEHLTKRFAGSAGTPVVAVNDLSFTVEPDEWLVLLGPSGCGKTTTLRLLAGLEPPTSGTMLLDGACITNAISEDVAMVFQNGALYPHLSVYENLAFGLKVRRCPREETHKRVEQVADMLGLTQILHRNPSSLSGGQRQRVALGRALVRRAKVFLFDEPFSNLDVQMRAEFRLRLLKLKECLGAPVVYVTHDQTEAMALGSRVAVLNQGKLEQADTPLNVYQRPANRFVARFIGYPPMNLFPGTIAQTADECWFHSDAVLEPAGRERLKLRLPATLLPSLSRHAGKPILLGIRPESLSAAANVELQTAPGIVEAVEEAGVVSFVHLVVAGFHAVCRLSPNTGVRKNDVIQVAFDLRNAVVFDKETGAAIS